MSNRNKLIIFNSISHIQADFLNLNLKHELTGGFIYIYAHLYFLSWVVHFFQPCCFSPSLNLSIISQMYLDVFMIFSGAAGRIRNKSASENVSIDFLSLYIFWWKFLIRNKEKFVFGPFLFRWFPQFVVWLACTVLTSTSSNTSTMNWTTDCEPESVPHISVETDIESNPCSRFNIRRNQRRLCVHKLVSKYWSLHFIKQNLSHWTMWKHFITNFLQMW